MAQTIIFSTPCKEPISVRNVPEFTWFTGSFGGYSGLFYKPSTASSMRLIYFSSGSTVTWGESANNEPVSDYRPAKVTITVRD
jgi:hypothetical protein